MTTAISILSILFYLAAMAVQWRNIPLQRPSLARLVIILGWVAIVFHGYMLHRAIDLPYGQNLVVFNIFSMVLWLVALLTLLTLIRLPVLNLMLFIFPLNALSIVLILIYPQQFIIMTQHHPEQLIHIFLSVLVFSFMCIAALQAILLIIQDHALKQKQNVLIRILPPLQIMESFLFQTIWVGFILLSADMLLAFLFFSHLLNTHLLPKIIFSLIAWLLYIILLAGRYFFGWRGKIAIRCTLLGFMILLITYFCTYLFK